MIEKYGRARVRQVVAHFYGRVLASSQLAHYFDSVDIHGLADHQSAFLGAVMGGPASHGRDDIDRAHRSLDITDEDFDAMLDLLEGSLQRHDIEAEDIEDVLSRYQAFRGAVVGAGAQ